MAMLRKAGALEVHLRIASPPLKHPCYMGINIPSRHELIANHLGPAELARHLGADSLVYLTIDGLLRAVRAGIPDADADAEVGHCIACLNGRYPVPILEP